MSDILCVTNRRLCEGDFLGQLESVALAGPAGVILREKDLPEAEYEDLARQVLAICRAADVPCILHSAPAVAQRLGVSSLHMPLPALRRMTPEARAGFSVLGTSCHSVEEAKEAQQLGCSYITAGHVFATDCKRGVEPRGLGFLRAVCQSVEIPVYAIGGIKAEVMPQVRRAGAAGACVMSGLMRSTDPQLLLRELAGR